MPRSGNTRERLVNTASRIFRSHGYSGSGVLEIQREAGISTGSFYHFFSSKEELLLAVVESALDTAGESLGAVEASNSAPLERIHALFELHRRILLEEDFQRGSPLAMLGTEFDRYSGDVQERLLQIQDLYINTIESWLEDGRFRPGLTPHSLAELIYSLLEGSLLQSRLTKNSEAFSTSTTQLDALLRMGLETTHVVPGDAGTSDSGQTALPEVDESGWKSW